MTDLVSAARRFFEEGLNLMARGELAEAECCFREALRLVPGRPSCQINLANCLLRSGQLEEAEELARAVIRQDLGAVGGWLALAGCMEKMRRHAEALAIVDKLLAEHGTAPDLELNRGGLLRALGHAEPGLGLAQAVLQSDPDAVPAKVLAANCLLDLGRDVEALQVLGGLDHRSDLGYEARLCLGNTFKANNRHREAMQWLDAALAFSPSGTAARYSRAQLLGEMGEHSQAVTELERLMADWPAEEDWRMSLSASYLKLGHYERAWPLYQARFSVIEKPTPQRVALKDRPWRGGSFAHLLIWGEQGVGDEIFFLGLLPKIVAIPGRKTLALDPRLVPLLERWRDDLSIVSYEQVAQIGWDVHVPLGALPQMLGGYSPDDLRAASPVLSLPSPTVFRHDRRASDPRRVGLCWRGRRVDAPEKDLPLAEVLEAFRASSVELVVLHDDLSSAERECLDRSVPGRWLGLALEPGESDVAGLARQICGCDAVVTSSSTTAHIAAGLDIQTVVLVSVGPRAFFYWGVAGGHGPWYRSVTALYQTLPGDWSGPLRCVGDFVAKQCRHVGKVDNGQ